MFLKLGSVQRMDSLGFSGSVAALRPQLRMTIFRGPAISFMVEMTPLNNFMVATETLLRVTIS